MEYPLILDAVRADSALPKEYPLNHTVFLLLLLLKPIHCVVLKQSATHLK